MQSLFITILIFFLPFLSTFSAVFGAWTLAGGWTPNNATDPTVIGVGKFAVEEHNFKDHASLEFKIVVKGESQVVAGTQYNITLTAVDGIAVNNYVALVWDKPWERFRQLVSFNGPV